MQLEELGIPAKKQAQLNKAGIYSAEELLEYFPRKYQDRSQITGLTDMLPECTFLFKPQRIQYVNARVPLVRAQGTALGTGEAVEIKWFNQAYLYSRLRDLTGKTVIVSGKAVRKDFNGTVIYEISAPGLFAAQGSGVLGIYPVYRKVPGMSDEYLRGCIEKAASALGPPGEIVPETIVQKNGLLSHGEMVKALHKPASAENLRQAQRRQLWNDLLYFALRIELDSRTGALGSPFNLAITRMTESVKRSLPYQLTPDQEATYQDCLSWIRKGKRLNALIQGDVGSGKTIVAALLMIAFAENGYQAVMMAPTQILARQHYATLLELVAPIGMEVVLVSGEKLKKAARMELEKKLSSGDAKLIVGTQALLSSGYQFHRLALVVEDEEHKYGVLQRKALAEKASDGTHTICMSATPIPRSLAQTIYGENLQLYSIKTRPAGRKPVKTGIATDMERVYSYIAGQVKRFGRQAYVVCPMITANEKMDGVDSVEVVFERYKAALEPMGIRLGMLTGKSRKQDVEDTLTAFGRNEISVLVSTTVIEVGINVPNATTIVIHNAERFGLAQLHQLRGRVGRGNAQGVCVLLSPEDQNQRLAAMCATSDGFAIAEMDLKQRGAGDFLGSRQSGTEKYLALALCNQDEYQAAQAAAKEILDSGEDCQILERADQDRQNNVGGEMLSG